MKNDASSGQYYAMKTDKNIHGVKQLVRNDRRSTARMIVHELSLNRKSMQIILFHDLRMQKVCAKLVPKILSEN